MNALRYFVLGVALLLAAGCERRDPKKDPPDPKVAHSPSAATTVRP